MDGVAGMVTLDLPTYVRLVSVTGRVARDTVFAEVSSCQARMASFDVPLINVVHPCP